MKCILVDMDGTLADHTHRLHLAPMKGDSWDAFNKDMWADPVNEAIADVVRILSAYYKIVIATSRPSHCLDVTVSWLRRNTISHRAIFMRPPDDNRPDVDVKRDMLQEIRDAGFDPILAIEDRVFVGKMYEEAGITCLLHGAGDVERVMQRSET